MSIAKDIKAYSMSYNKTSYCFSCQINKIDITYTQISSRLQNKSNLWKI